MAIVATFLVFNSAAQSVASFDELPLTPESFWNGSNLAGSFKSSGITFHNSYNAEFNFWGGFAYSNLTDATTASFENQYSAIAGQGNEGSSNYALCYPSPSALAEFTVPTKASGFYVTNSTYAYWSMKNGDAFSKKFGGETGNDPDFFQLMIEALDAESKPVDTLYFYLADFRFEDNSKDYILNQWTWVDLGELKEGKTLRFSLSSSDNSLWGMNTPGYFCMDDLKVENFTSIPQIEKVQAMAYPNPFTDHIAITGLKSTASVTLTDISGRRIREYFNVVNNQPIGGLENLKSGVYFLRITDGTNQLSTKLVKK